MLSANRAYEASVHVRGRPVREVPHRGQTYIEGRQGSEYTLYFKNTTGERVLLIPSVDGLCVINGEKAGHDSPGFIIDPWGDITIPGWMVNGTTAAKFIFRPQDSQFEKTYVEQLASEGAPVEPGCQGLIGFRVIGEKVAQKSFFNRPPYRSSPGEPWEAPVFGSGPLDSIRASGTGTPYQGTMFSATSSVVGSMNTSASVGDADWLQQQSEGLGTGFGSATPFKTEQSFFNRGEVRAEMVLEYDTLRGLKNRGVPVNLLKSDYAVRSAFPADSVVGCKPPAGWRG